MANTFDWIEIRTHDIQKTAAFYEALFGWRVTEKETAGGTAVWLFDAGSEPRLQNLKRGGLWLRPASEPLGIVVYIAVEDIEATLEKVSELGGRVTGSKMDLGGGYSAFFEDPSGNLLGLYQDREPAV